MKVLIAYGSKLGGTAGLAEMIGADLTAAGLQVTVRPAKGVDQVDDFDAVVIAGALYTNRWHRDARRFASRHAPALRDRPVWLVASGPLDESALEGQIAPVAHVAKALAEVGARGQVTFGGRLEAEPRNFMARGMAKKMAGDWRDPRQVHEFASTVAHELAHMSEPD